MRIYYTCYKLKTNILHIILFSFITSTGYAQVEITTPDGTYQLDKAFSDYTIGVILYESYKYKEPEDYKKVRIDAIEMITKSADAGYSPAQFYLGTIYLNDSLIRDRQKGIVLLKKSAYQRNADAIDLLDKLGEEYEIAIDYPFLYKTVGISLAVLIFLIFSILTHVKISKSRYITKKYKKRLIIIVWFLPYFGGIIGLLRQRKIIIPLDKENIDWIRNCFDWIRKEFGNDIIFKSDIILPIKEKIPVEMNSTKESAIKLVSFVASKMQIDPKEIKIDFYNQSQMELGSHITQRYENDKFSSGQYHGKKLDNKYQISLEISQLKNPVGLIATIAHELSHIKLLGEKRIKENDEYLTDLIPIIFGFGIFSANSIFHYSQDSFGWRANSQGYLSERVFGFALATHANLRNDLNPTWSSYLSATIKEEFERSMIYIKNSTR